MSAAVAVAVVAVGGAAATQVANGAQPKRPAATTVKLKNKGACCKFSVSTLHARHGKITLKLSNSASIPHAIAVGSKKGKSVSNGTSTVTVNLKKGRYTFYCPVPGHRAAGMKGTLVVS